MEQKHCTSCKHYKHDSQALPHPDRCTRFPVDGIPVPCVVARSDLGACGHDVIGWESE
jgi:hypothetical protein